MSLTARKRFSDQPVGVSVSASAELALSAVEGTPENSPAFQRRVDATEKSYVDKGSTIVRNLGGAQMAHSEPLTVTQIAVEDTWKDIVRIKNDHRRDINNKHIKRGAICRLKCGNYTKWVVVHGRVPSGNTIEMDLSTRLALEVQNGQNYNFTLTRLSWLRSLWFPWKASDPIYRVPAQLALISLLLGFILGMGGIMVGFYPVYTDYVKEHRAHQTSAQFADRK